MSLKSKPYYWVACDFPTETGTHDRSAQENSDFAAWAEESVAIDSAIGDGEWVASADGEKHYCWDHPRISQEDLDDGEEPPKLPYLLLNDDDEATLVLEAS